jgi:hypothetical protein
VLRYINLGGSLPPPREVALAVLEAARGFVDYDVLWALDDGTRSALGAIPSNFLITPTVQQVRGADACASDA